MPSLDRFARGLPDPQEQEPAHVMDCTNVECSKPIYAGDKVWRDGSELYCCLKCLAADRGAYTIYA
ncbi:hypothetical protein VE23_25030 [Paenibacillus sp. D9]|nr:hypothetical protein VE23_25030 [Paenibacillus sp. D9]